MTDWALIATKYRHQRNSLSKKCKYLEGRLKARNNRIGELKVMLNKHGINWRLEDEKRRHNK